MSRQTFKRESSAGTQEDQTKQLNNNKVIRITDLGVKTSTSRQMSAINRIRKTNDMISHFMGGARTSDQNFEANKLILGSQETKGIQRENSAPRFGSRRVRLYSKIV